MSKRLVVVIDGESQLEFDRLKLLSTHQLSYLDQMDQQMDPGVQLGNDFIADPNQLQRAQFVAVSLVQAIRQQEDALAAATCSYLAQRMPELRQVKVQGEADKQTIDLVFDRDFVKSVPVQFVKPGKLNS